MTFWYRLIYNNEDGLEWEAHGVPVDIISLRKRKTVGDVEVVQYRKDRPDKGWLKSTWPSREILLCFSIAGAGSTLLMTGIAKGFTPLTKRLLDAKGLSTAVSLER